MRIILMAVILILVLILCLLVFALLRLAYVLFRRACKCFREGKPLAGIAFAGCSLLPILVGPVLFDWATKGSPVTDERAKSIFANYTGISLTSDSSIIGFKNSHNGFNGNGEIGIVVRLSEQAMQTLASGDPPLGDKWMKGPVEGRLGSHCAFIYSKRPQYWGWPQGEEGYYDGTPEVIELLTNPDIQYCAVDRRPQSIPWYHGTLLVLRPTDSTVWLSAWNW